jgi:hypothetical protein
LVTLKIGRTQTKDFGRRFSDHAGSALLMPVKLDLADAGAAGHGAQAQQASIRPRTLCGISALEELQS